MWGARIVGTVRPRAWEQLLRATRSVDDELTPGDYSVASIAASASNPDVVYIAVGNDFNPADIGHRPEPNRSGSAQ